MTQNNVRQMNDYMAINQDSGQVLGKLLYYSLGNVLVEKSDLIDLCDAIGMPCTAEKRASTIDAFRNATGDIYKRITMRDGNCVRTYKIYCRDNQTVDGLYSRELVQEEMDDHTNEYIKLANISYDKKDNRFDYGNLQLGVADPLPFCQEAEKLFELYQICVGRRQLETISENYLAKMEAIKISIHGKLYFVPQKHMHMVELFEDFVEQLGTKNRHTENALTVNSMFVADDQKQREKMAAEFYKAVGQEIELYQERANYLIQSGSQSPAIMDRWVMKIEQLELKKKHYEDILKNDFEKLNDGFSTLKFLSQEMQVRAKNLRFQKKAA